MCLGSNLGIPKARVTNNRGDGETMTAGKPVDSERTPQILSG